MPNHADEPLRKTTLNLYEADIDRLKRKYGWGWSEEVRRMVRRRLNELDARSDQMRGVENEKTAGVENE